MVLLRKIFHLDACRIGLVFGFDAEEKQKAIALGARWSNTHKCWYVDYSPAAYQSIRQTFPDFRIEPPEPAALIQPVPGTNRRTDNAGKKEATAPNAGPSNRRVGQWVETRVLDVRWKQSLQCQLIDLKSMREGNDAYPHRVVDISRFRYISPAFSFFKVADISHFRCISPTLSLCK